MAFAVATSLVNGCDRDSSVFYLIKNCFFQLSNGSSREEMRYKIYV